MLTDIMLGQYFPGNSAVHRLDPRTKILLTLLCISSIFLAADYSAYLLLSVFLAMIIGIARIPVKIILRSIRPLWIILVLTAGIHLFMTPGVTLFAMGPLSITHEGLRQGIQMSARLILLILISSLLTFTTSPIALTDAIERLLYPFKLMKLPVHELAMMMTIALRFVPTLLEETDRIMKAQMARGADFFFRELAEAGTEYGSIAGAIVYQRLSTGRRFGYSNGGSVLPGRRASYTHERTACRRKGHSCRRDNRDDDRRVGMVAMGLNAMDRKKRNLKLTIAYDGSGYHGFQRQLNACTVQQVLEEKLSNLLNERIAVAGAARTDAGVHAYGQVVSFWTESAIPTERIPIAMAGILPRDIAVVDAASMPMNFHARFSSCSKIYLYRIHNTTVPNPLLRNHAWQVHRQLDSEAMHAALQSLAGEHDFSSFQAAGSSARNPVRTLYAVKCERQGK